MKVLITGGSGTIGTALRELDAETVFLDRVPKNPLLGELSYIEADVRDRDSLRSAMQGCDALIHCAGSVGPLGDWDANRENIIGDNIEGLMVAFEIAKELSLDRIIFASSNHAVGMYEVDNAPQIYEFGHSIDIKEDTETRPDSLYGVTKVFGESYGRFIAENGGPKCYCLRIGAIRTEDLDHPYAFAEAGVKAGKWERGSEEYVMQEKRLKALWLSQRDFVQIVEKALHYEGPPFDIFNAVSDNSQKWFSLEKAKADLDYQPQDNAEGWIQIMTRFPRDKEGNATKPSTAEDLEIAALIAIRREAESSIEFQKTLLGKTIEFAKSSSCIRKIALSTDCQDFVDYANVQGVDFAFIRPAWLSEQGVRADQVHRHTIQHLNSLDYHPDLVAPLESIYPFRYPGLLEELLEKLLQDGLDTAIPSHPEYRPAWVKQSDQIVRLDEYDRLRNKREPIHIGLSTMACITYSEFMLKGRRLGPRIGILDLDDKLCSLETRSEKEYKRLMSRINGLEKTE